MATSLQFALSNPTPGMDTEFNHWYGGEHLTHGVLTHGVLAGQRFKRVADDGPLPGFNHGYLMIWEFDDPRYALDELAKVKGGDNMPISPAIDMSTVQPPTMWLRASVRNAARIATDTAHRRSVVLALFNPEADGEAPFLARLLGEQLRAIADLPGVIAADFLTLADEQIRGNARKFRYSLLVELADETSALPTVSQALLALPHVDRSKWQAGAFRPLGPRLTAVDARRLGEHA